MPPLPLLLPVACLAYFGLRYHSPAYLACGIPVLAGYFLLQARWDQIGKTRLGLYGFTAIGVSLGLLGAWQFLNLEDRGDIDHASYSQALWNLRQGNFEFHFHDRNMFGIHSQYTAVLWVPVHWLFGELGLKVGNGLCFLAAALLLVFRSRQPRPIAWWGGLLVLLAPPVASQFFFGFHPEVLAAPVLVLLLIAYRDERLPAFLACAAFLAFTKETMTLAVGSLLLLALLERRAWTWWLLPGLLVTAQMALYWFVIMPRFAPTGNHLDFFMPALGDIPRHWARLNTLGYFWHAYLPFLPLLIASPKRYWILPLPLMAFYASFPDPLFLGMWTNYVFPLVFLAAAPLLLDKAAPTRDGRVVLAGAVIALLSYPIWREAMSFPDGRDGRPAQVAAYRKDIPQEAAVLINGNFHVPFASRKETALWGWNTDPLAHYDYVVMDTSFHPPMLANPKKLARDLAILGDTTAWSRLETGGTGGITLYKRLGPRAPRNPAGSP